jgi:hypothetical protein
MVGVSARLVSLRARQGPARWARFAGFLIVAWGLIGCRQPAEPASAPGADVAIEPAAPFERGYRLIDSVVLEQTKDAPIVRVSGLALGTSGLLLGDVSEGNVKLFDYRGRLQRILGRKGNGPGEFSAPRFPRFAADGSILVADGQSSRVNVFDPSGEPTRTITVTDGLVPIMGFQLLPDKFLMTGTVGEEFLFYRIDTTGRTVREEFSRSRAHPRIRPDSPFWKSGLQAWLGLQRDTVVMVSTLSDTLWTMDLASGRWQARRLMVPGYLEPVPLEAPARSAAELMEWQKSFHAAAALYATSQLIAIPFVRGVLNYGDPSILVVRDADDRWTAWTGAPPVVAAAGDTLATILHPETPEIMAIGLFRRR